MDRQRWGKTQLGNITLKSSASRNLKVWIQRIIMEVGEVDTREEEKLSTCGTEIGENTGT